jgi:hypothetical protein
VLLGMAAGLVIFVALPVMVVNATAGWCVVALGAAWWLVKVIRSPFRRRYRRGG